MSIAFSYVRFSSKKQEQGDSVRRQTALARSYADAHALILDERSYQDLGISAFKGKNAVEGALGAFIDAVDRGLIPKNATLLVESMDRLSRQEVDDALELFLSITRRGITIVTLSDGLSYSRASIKANWTKLIVALAMMAGANESSATKAMRVREAWEAKRAAGGPMTAMGPSWLQLVNGKWRPIKEKVAVVREAFKRAAKGEGTPTIATHLNSKGMLPLGGKAELWTPELVMALLRNRAVVGDLVPRNKALTTLPRYYPEIVKPVTFNLVQSHINERRRTGGRQGGTGFNANLLSGRLFCQCGSKMRYVSSNKPHIYVRCLKAYSKMGCDAQTWPYAILEENFLEAWFLLVPKVNDFTSETEPDQRIVLQAELEQKEKALQNLIAVAAAGAQFSGGTGALAAAIEKAQKEVDGLQKDLRTTPGRMAKGDYIDAAFDLWDAYRLSKRLSPKWLEARSQIEALIRMLVDRVVVEKHSRIDKGGVEDGKTYPDKEYGRAEIKAGKRTEWFDFPLPKWGFGRKRAI